MKTHKLPRSFYLRENVQLISQELLGKVLVSFIDGKLTSGIITETEAYQAPEDKASHAFGNKKTPRTEVFYMEGAIGYVYLCYGIHNLFNVVTNKKGIPHAILIRSLEPLEGIETMMQRRKKNKLDKTLTAGPGALSQALGINKLHNKISLLGDDLWIEDRNIHVDSIHATTRVGIDYAEEYKDKPWRYYIKGNKWISKV
ncbi:DNA-3-methyladenine glycosylase [Cytophaga aurantiaca]|uniref:DNA-3-methyladenine glycosylase n=1 Tax=Cytophaga aurantiaca TaxID=29530 RepID=UPI00037A3FE7|nr:DNA-3-methyladenine glycosylase [Cytophaga aurantiaca]